MKCLIVLCSVSTFTLRLCLRCRTVIGVPQCPKPMSLAIYAALYPCRRYRTDSGVPHYPKPMSLFIDTAIYTRCHVFYAMSKWNMKAKVFLLSPTNLYIYLLYVFSTYSIYMYIYSVYILLRLCFRSDHILYINCSILLLIVH